MDTREIVTIVTAILETGGLATYFGLTIKGLRNVINSQKGTLEAMEKRINETQKITDLYKTMIDTLPSDIEQFKVITSKLKDETINELKKANEEKNNTIKMMAEKKLIEIKSQEDLIKKIDQNIVSLTIARQSVEPNIQDIFPGKWENLFTFPGTSQGVEPFEIKDGNKYYVQGVHRFNIVNFNKDDKSKTITFTKEWVGGISKPYTNILKIIDWGHFEGIERNNIKVTYRRVS